MKFAALILLASSAVSAQPDRLVFNTALGPMHLIEASTVQGMQRVWLSLERTTRGSDGVASDKMLFELDCRAQNVRTTRRSYSGANGTGELLETQQSGWAPPTPGVVAHKLMRRYCR